MTLPQNLLYALLPGPGPQPSPIRTLPDPARTDKCSISALYEHKSRKSLLADCDVACARHAGPQDSIVGLHEEQVPEAVPRSAANAHRRSTVCTFGRAHVVITQKMCHDASISEARPAPGPHCYKLSPSHFSIFADPKADCKAKTGRLAVSQGTRTTSTAPSRCSRPPTRTASGWSAAPRTTACTSGTSTAARCAKTPTPSPRPHVSLPQSTS